jgi:acyl-CoA-binding protein
MQGLILNDHAMVKQLIEKAQTKTGLSISVSIIDKVYTLGKKATKGFKESMKLGFDEILGQWNYKATPMLECSLIAQE